jgi:hypothetical protein
VFFFSFHKIFQCRGGVAAGWHTMMATAFLLLGEFFLGEGVFACFEEPGMQKGGGGWVTHNDGNCFFVTG